MCSLVGSATSALGLDIPGLQPIEDVKKLIPKTPSYKPPPLPAVPKAPEPPPQVQVNKAPAPAPSPSPTALRVGKARRAGSSSKKSTNSKSRGKSSLRIPRTGSGLRI